TSRTIVGVVRDMDYNAGVFDANSMQIFIPSHTPGAFYPTFAIRVDGDAQSYLTRVRDAVQSVDNQVPVFGAKTMHDRLSEVLVRPRVYSALALSFAGFAMLLAVIGVYGLVSYAVSEKSQE